MPPAFSTQPAGGANLPYPALYLYPLNDSFVPKHIALSHGQHVKIGRQTNAKTAPGERNGYFDSKVLSRQHAEVWEESGKIFIKDVKSSNGTFINGERLSSEAVESEPYELKSDDIVEFGIDIVGDDNKTIIHHKVAARVACIFTEQDAVVAGRSEAHAREGREQNPTYAANQTHTAPSGFNFGTGQGGQQQAMGVANMAAQQRRPPLSQPTLGSMSNGSMSGGTMGNMAGIGGMGAMRPPGKSGLSFDVILSRLQGELQKSRETGAELGTLTGVLGEVGDVLGGGLPTSLPHYPSNLPPVRPSASASAAAAASEPPAPPPAGGLPPPPGPAHSSSSSSSSSAPEGVINEASDASKEGEPSSKVADGGEEGVKAGGNRAIEELQAQLRETQESLASQVAKIRALEGVLGNDNFRRFVDEKHGLQRLEEEQAALKRAVEEQEEMRRELEHLKAALPVSTRGEHPMSTRPTPLETLLETEEPEPIEDAMGGGRHDEGHEAHDSEQVGQEEDEEEDEDDDDARSACTVTPRLDDEEEEEDEGDFTEVEAPRKATVKMGKMRSGTIRAGHKDKPLGDVGVKAITKTGVVPTSTSRDDDKEKEKEREGHDDDVRAEIASLSKQVAEMAEVSRKLEALQVGARMGVLDAVSSKLASLDSVSARLDSLDSVSSKLSALDDDALAKLATVEAVSSKMTSFEAVSSKLASFDAFSSRLDSFEAVSARLDAFTDLGKKLESITQLAERLESVVQLTTVLEAQHSAAQSTIAALEGKVEVLEGMLRAQGKDASKDASTSSPSKSKNDLEVVGDDPSSTLTDKISEWMKSHDTKWTSMTTEWAQERERLKGAREEWEAKVKQFDTSLQTMASLQAETTRLVPLGSHGVGNGGIYVNGDVLRSNGLVTPPSPRSQSSDSGRHRRSRQGRRSPRRPASGSESASTSESEAGSEEEEVGGPSSSSSSRGGVKTGKTKRKGSKGGKKAYAERPDSPILGVGSVDEDEDEGTDELHSEASVSARGSLRGKVLDTSSLPNSISASGSMPTPAASVADVDPASQVLSLSSPSKEKEKEGEKGVEFVEKPLVRPNNVHVQTAVGVLLLSVAAAAVIWKVKPETT